MTYNEEESVRSEYLRTINEHPKDRDTLSYLHGVIWDTGQLQEDFIVHGFLAPFVHVTRKSDDREGSLTFQHNPRFYFLFEDIKE